VEEGADAVLVAGGDDDTVCVVCPAQRVDRHREKPRSAAPQRQRSETLSSSSSVTWSSCSYSSSSAVYPAACARATDCRTFRILPLVGARELARRTERTEEQVREGARRACRPLRPRAAPTPARRGARSSRCAASRLADPTAAVPRTSNSGRPGPAAGDGRGRRSAPTREGPPPTSSAPLPRSPAP
jgi:hypothetical protein